MTIATKACKKCGVTHPATKDFFGHTPSGNLRGTCRLCVNAASKKHQQDRPDLMRARANRYQARKKRWTPTMELRALLHEEQSGFCLCCSKPMTLSSKLHVDHLRPTSQGGSNDASNLILLHAECNQEKHSKTFTEYLAWRQKCGLPMPEFCTEKVLAHIAGQA